MGQFRERESLRPPSHIFEVMATHPEKTRETQRAPRSCFFCSRRKTKCDKSIPCQACRSRGQANDCFVETVKVKGQVVRYVCFPLSAPTTCSQVLISGYGLPSSGQAPSTQPSYAELLEENERLRSLALRGQFKTTARPISSLALMDQQEQEL